MSHPRRLRQRLYPLALAVAALTAQAEIHKCVVDGKTLYSESPCAGEQSGTVTLPEINGIGGATSSHTGSLWLRDASGYATASRASTAEGVPVLIYAYTDWCTFCKKLESDYFSDYRVSGTLRQFIKVRLNTEQSAANNALFTRWGGTGYPSLFIQQPGQTLPQRVATPTLRNTQATRQSRDTFSAALQQFLPATDAPTPH